MTAEGGEGSRMDFISRSLVQPHWTMRCSSSGVRVSIVGGGLSEEMLLLLEEARRARVKARRTFSEAMWLVSVRWAWSCSWVNDQRRYWLDAL